MLRVAALFIGSLSLLSGPLAASAVAQPQATGIIVDTTGAPVAAVTVVITDTAGRTDRTQTGADGRFVFTAITPGQARLSTDAVGWEPLAINLVVPTEEDLRLVLQPAGLLETVVVIGDVGPWRALHPDSTSLIGSVDIVAADQIEREDVDLAYELLKKVPGVYVNDYNQGVVAGGIGIADSIPRGTSITPSC